MNKDIYPFVAQLIEDYERDLINSIASDPKDSNAKALFASPLQAMILLIKMDISFLIITWLMDVRRMQK